MISLRQLSLLERQEAMRYARVRIELANVLLATLSQSENDNDLWHLLELMCNEDTELMQFVELTISRIFMEKGEEHAD